MKLIARKGFHALDNGRPRSAAGRPVVFLDRDGTLIYDRPGFYLHRPEQIRGQTFVISVHQSQKSSLGRYSLSFILSHGLRSMAIDGPYSTLVASLNLKRWILPNVVFGNSSTKSMLCGYWYR